MAESKGYYTYGDVKDFIINYNPSQGCYVISKNKFPMVSKNAISSLQTISKEFTKNNSINVINKSTTGHSHSIIKSVNSHYNYINVNNLQSNFKTENNTTNQYEVYTQNIGFYELTSIGQIARYNLNISTTPSDSIIKINDTEQSSYNGYETEEITYEVSCDGYASRMGSLTLLQNIDLNITLSLEVHLTINVDQEDAVVVVNGIEGKEHILGQGDEVSITITCNDYKTYTNTFIIEEDTVLDVVLEKNIITVVYPGSTLPSTVTTSGIGSSSSSAFYNSGSSLYSNSGSYGVNNGSSYAYIKFTTPNETTTLSLQAYVSSEANYDYGGVYVGTKEYRPAKSSISGQTTDGYGSWLMSSSGSNSSYATYTKTLEPNTTYYINFSYAKDGSRHDNSDRIFIKNITFMTMGDN